ncbi:Siroheme synthase [Aspergillus sp. HF37]|nr:Siroheme synthase [Aspergillus sp. HF37]
MPRHFPPVQPGGSLIVAWQARNKHVLVVGGGEVAAGRILHALNADANVTVVCPRSGLNDEVSFRISENQVSHIDRPFEPGDLDGADLVLCAIDDPAASSRVWQLCKDRRIPANIADVPAECDFFFGSIHRDGPLQIMVSTNGNGPKMASLVRRKIADVLPDNTGSAIDNVGRLRRKLREVAPDPGQGPKRMKWISTVCETWSLEELVQMDDRDMDRLLAHYESGKIPSFSDTRSN